MLFNGRINLIRDDGFLGSGPGPSVIAFRVKFSSVNRASIFYYGSPSPQAARWGGDLWTPFQVGVTDYGDQSNLVAIPTGALANVVIRISGSDGNTAEIYLNGVLASADSNNTFNTMPGGVFSLGADYSAGAAGPPQNPLTGELTDVAAWNGDLTQAQCAAISGGASPMEYAPTAYWPLSADTKDHGPLYPIGYDLSPAAVPVTANRRRRLLLGV